MSMHPIPRAGRPRLLLAAAAALPAALCLTLAAVLSGCGSHAGASPAASSDMAPDTVWPYYAETVAIRPPAYDSPLNVSIRSTVTGDESAALRAPQPDESVGFVVGTGQPGRWIVGVQPWHPVRYDNSAQPAKLYLATLNPVTADGETLNDPTLTPLPPPPMRASQLINGTAQGSSARELAAATLSPDGRRLALLTTQRDTYQVSVYPVTGDAAARTWSGRVSPESRSFDWGWSLTWLSGDKTLAVGVAADDGTAGRTAAVHYLNTASPSSSLAKASRTVTLSFPARKAKTGTPDGCSGAPVVTGDGQRVLCSGAATFPVNPGGATEVGLWVFSAQTGTLTAAWDRHTICCALVSTDFPRILWVSPHGDLLIADGMSTQNQGAQLILRAADGTLRRLPWKGLVQRPGQVSITEPSVAW
ncbi:MAG TPA: hypothetical protein VHF26_13885 [Trebonia sp.]|nr:hypothetical protein [Trebonia sp.]